MKLDPEKDLLQSEKPTNAWLCKDVSHPDIIRGKSSNVTLPLSPENELVMQKLIDFVRWSQDSTLNFKSNGDYLRPAVGLAAPQIGSNTNMFFARFEWKGSDAEEYAMINPVITAKSTQIACLDGGEGCLSVDVDQSGNVPRSYKIEVTAYDYFTREEVNLTLRGYRAIVFQHEIDHNHGKLYYDHIDAKDENYFEKEWIFV
jgi:peptide deformylase